MLGSIYIIKNKVNDKVYIGQTTMTIQERWMLHRKPSTIKDKIDYKFYQALDLYGEESFFYELLEGEIPVDKLDEREMYYIKQYDSYHGGYNGTNGGKGGKEIVETEDIHHIITEYNKGRSANNIAKDYKVHGATIQRLLRENGIKLRKDGRKLEPCMLDDMIELAKTHTYTELGEVYKVNEKTIRRFLKKHGFTKRKSKKGQTTIREE